MVERPQRLDDETASYIDDLLITAEAEGAFAVVLTGSMARDVPPTLWSDVDVYVLGLSVGETPALVHLLEASVAQFVEQIRSGDDVAQWAARFGRPLFGESRWSSLVRTALRGAPWPDHRVKLRQSRRRLEVSRWLLDAGDASSAQKELVYAASHLARAILFDREVFPLSRPELPAQLRGVDEGVIAGIVESLASTPIGSVGALNHIWAAIERRGTELDRDAVAAAKI